MDFPCHQHTKHPPLQLLVLVLTVIPLKPLLINQPPPVDQRLQRQFQPAATGHQHIPYNSTADMPLLVENVCGISRLLPLLRNPYLKDDTLIFSEEFL